LRVYGARTLSSDPAWRYVNVRRTTLMIKRALSLSLQWVVFETHDIYLRQLLTIAISSFLGALWQRGALVGETAEQAFYVRCDEENNRPNTVANGQLFVDVGVALVRPAEFIVLRIGRTEDELQITELSGALA
jgi:phage tail sheath protein FI